jgi:hypothetical protein
MWQTYSTGSRFEQMAPYSRALHDDEWVFVSGTTGFDYPAMTLSDDVGEQCRQASSNVRVHVGDDDRLILRRADPHLRSDQPGRGRVAHGPEPDRLVGVDQPGLPERGGIRRGGHHMRPLAFDQQAFGRDRDGLPMPPGVHVAQNASHAAINVIMSG